MFVTIYETAYHYLHFYHRSALLWWDQLGPWDYGTVLALVGTLGYCMMRGNKR